MCQLDIRNEVLEPRGIGLLLRLAKCPQLGTWQSLPRFLVASHHARATVDAGEVDLPKIGTVPIHTTYKNTLSCVYSTARRVNVRVSKWLATANNPCLHDW